MTELTPPVKRFADNYLKDGKKQANALKEWSNLTPQVASVKANRLLKNDNVQAYIKSQAKQSAENIAKIANSKKHDSITLRANQDILDRAGYKPTPEQEVPTTPKDIKDQAGYLQEIAQAIKEGDTVTLERIILSS